MTKRVTNILLLLVFPIGLEAWLKPMESRDCNLLPDGKYKLEYTANTVTDSFLIEISKDRFSRYNSLGVVSKGSIAWHYKCSFVMKHDGAKEDTTNRIINIIRNSFGEHLIELVKTNGDTIFFRTAYTGNLHVTVNGGRFIRLRN